MEAASSPPPSDGADEVAATGDPVLEGNGITGNTGAVVAAAAVAVGSTDSAVGDMVAVIAGAGVAAAAAVVVG